MPYARGMRAKFQQVVALGAAFVGSADAYDMWAQQEQARVLIEYAQQQLAYRRSSPSSGPLMGVSAEQQMQVIQ